MRIQTFITIITKISTKIITAIISYHAITKIVDLKLYIKLQFLNPGHYKF